MNDNQKNFIIETIVSACVRGLQTTMQKEYVLRGEFVKPDYWYFRNNLFTGIIRSKFNELGYHCDTEVTLNDTEEVMKYKIIVSR